MSVPIHRHTHMHTRALAHTRSPMEMTQCGRLRVYFSFNSHTILYFKQRLIQIYTCKSLWPQNIATLQDAKMIRCLKLQDYFRTYKALLRKMTYKGKASYASSPPCAILYTSSANICNSHTILYALYLSLSLSHAHMMIVTHTDTIHTHTHTHTNTNTHTHTHMHTPNKQSQTHAHAPKK